MTDMHSEPAPRRRGDPDRLKGDIDSGRTGDKTPGYDPGAAPLGTDAEAGGALITPELVQMDDAQETTARPDSSGPNANANAATPELQPDARLGPQRNLPAAVLIGVLIAIVLGVVLYMVL